MFISPEKLTFGGLRSEVVEDFGVYSKSRKEGADVSYKAKEGANFGGRAGCRPIEYMLDFGVVSLNAARGDIVTQKIELGTK